MRLEIPGSTQSVGKPLPQFKPSVSRRDAASEEKKKLRPELCVRVNSKVTCRILCQALDCYVYL